MKITIINGNMRRGSTWHCTDAIISEISKLGKTEVTEISLPRDLPHFCNGCFSCFYNGEHTCPHADYVKPIVDAITSSDLVVLSSPVYGLDVTGQMKAFIDHLCYMWMSHRPNINMFNKIGLTVSTTAGLGLRHTTKTMKNSLTFWGVKKIFSYKSPVSAMKWADVSEKKKAKIEKDTKKLAAKIFKAVNNVKRLRNPLFRSFMFKAMSGAQKKNEWNPTDRAHWEKHGWTSGKKPF